MRSDSLASAASSISRLHDAPVDLVELGRNRVDLDPQPARRLVHEVDRLVGKEPVGDVALGHDGGRHERGVLDPDAVVHLVALLQAAQDADRILDRRLADEDGLEAPCQRGVLLDVLAVLVEGRRADGAQLAPGKHRLEQVRGVDRTLGTAGADDRVELVDEQHDLAFRGGDLRQDALQALLELAAVLRPCEQGADVEREDATAA